MSPHLVRGARIEVGANPAAESFDDLPLGEPTGSHDFQELTQYLGAVAYLAPRLGQQQRQDGTPHPVRPTGDLPHPAELVDQPGEGLLLPAQDGERNIVRAVGTRIVDETGDPARSFRLAEVQETVALGGFMRWINFSRAVPGRAGR